MHITEDRISNLAHLIIEALWKGDLADFSDERLALHCVKDAIARYFAVSEEIDAAVRKKLASYSQAKVPGSREWDVLYHKFYQEELMKRKR